MKKDASAETTTPAAADWLVGGGEMGKLIRSMDWSKTPLGPIEDWPQSLRTTVSLCLASNFPISLAWGPDYVQLYNDGYWPICGGKHPDSMGQDFRECWASAWPAVGEAFTSALAGETSYLEDQRMFLDRNGYLEETFFTFSFSPIRDESGGIGGLFHPVTETTGRMLSERRTRALRDLAARTGKAQTPEEAFHAAAQTMAAYELDLPLVLLYSIDADGKKATLSASSGIAAGTAASPKEIDLAVSHVWGIGSVVANGSAIKVEHLEKEFPALQCGPYPEPPTTALSLPITPPGAERPVAVMVAGISPRLPFNEVYRGFCEQLTTILTAALANALAYEEERKRAEKLAELDQAKTTFFSNVSHEFRTPLMLMLGPLEEALEDAEISAPQRQRLDIAHRNSLRLLKLVNILLDFSRIEAGRMQASYEPLDLATYTADLASVFRSAIERAGLELVVDCPQLDEAVFVDRDMWEKIVLNLVSNAFKFTERGRITVRLNRVGGNIELAVQDTGCGIPADQLGNLFKRFYRIEGARGRTYEGTGIGLALVQELTKLHGGTVRVESSEAKGSTFTISIPLGKNHLPSDRVTTTSARTPAMISSDAYVAEAMLWSPDAGQIVEPVAAETLNPTEGAGRTRPRVLLADDNADVRDYVRRILVAEYDVCVAPDGESALAAARERTPDLVLSDIMMPRLDGFGLLRALRADPDTRTVPVIFLSARAGDEARVGGLEAGADDYLVKPFSSRELLARVRSNLELTRIRSEAIHSKQEALGAIKLLETVRESEERFRTLANAIPQLCWSANADGWVTWYNQRWYEYTGRTPEQMAGWGWQSVHDPQVLPQVLERWQASIATGKAFEMEFPLRGRDGQLRPFLSRAIPVHDVAGKLFQWFGTCTDITERKAAERALENLNAELETRVAERTAELREKDEILIQQNRQAAMGEMIGNIAHQWRQPLNSLGLLIQELLMVYDMGAFDRSFLEESVDRSMTLITHMSRTIDVFRNFFVSEKDIVRFKARETIRETLSFVEDSFRSQGIKIEIIAKQDPVIYGSTTEFAQVLINIVINAKEALTERNIADPKVTITIDSEGGSAVVLIRDNGGGIPDDIIGKVFDPYFSTKGPRQGTGIGLFMSKTIIEKKMRGTLVVGNVAGGAEFRIEVPSESSS
jgi:PAS domain S-box-containing protein